MEYFSDNMRLMESESETLGEEKDKRRGGGGTLTIIYLGFPKMKKIFTRLV